MTPARGERQNSRVSSTPRADDGSDAVIDARAIHRAITGLRDRLRLQEDELDTLRELIQPVPSNGVHPVALASSSQLDAIHTRVEQIRAEMYAHLNTPRKEPQVLRQPIDEGAIQERVEKSLLPRMHALETQLAEQGHQMVEQGKMLQEAFSVMGRTDTNLRRLIAQVDRLLEEASRRPHANPHHIEVTSETTDSHTPRRPHAREPLRPRQKPPMFTAVEDLDEFEEEEAPRFRWKFPLAILALLVCILAAIWYWYFRDTTPSTPLPPVSSTLSPIDQARSYENDKNYPKAEEVYRDILAKDPNNVEVIRHLASVLYREDKVDESAEVLKRLNTEHR